MDKEMAERVSDPDFMETLARGLAVLRCFGEKQQPMTIAQASHETGLSRASVRRCLHTLTQLGYAAQEGPNYMLRPKTLALGYAYLSSNTLVAKAQPILEQLRDELHESCSLGVIEEDEVYYVARAESSRIISIALRSGSRLPLYATSMGRVLLAGLPKEERDAYFRKTKLVPLTPHTVTDRRRLEAILDQVAEEGFALVDQELEVSLRSIAVPVIGRKGVTASINIGTQADRVTAAELRTRYLPVLRRGARDLSAMGSF